jgi:hypothetical protein
MKITAAEVKKGNADLRKLGKEIEARIKKLDHYAGQAVDFKDSINKLLEDARKLCADEKAFAERWAGPRGGASAIVGRPYEPPLPLCYGIRPVQLRGGALEAADNMVVEYGWFSKMYRLVRYLCERGPAEREEFIKGARKEWDARLRHQIGGKAFDRDAADYINAAELSEFEKWSQRNQQVGRVAVWDACLERRGIEGKVPVGWPHRWLRGGVFIPQDRPESAGEPGRSDKGIALGAYTRVPWRSHHGKTRAIEVTPEQAKLYLQRLASTEVSYRPDEDEILLDTRELPDFAKEYAEEEEDEG